MTADDLTRSEKENLWHPFTQMREWVAGEPLFIESGDGVRLRDREGREYYDGNSSLWVNVHGHRRPEIDAAIIDQLGRIAHSTMLGLTHAPAAELAARLVEIAPRPCLSTSDRTAGRAPRLTRVFYSDSGSEAVEIALKMAYQYWRHRDQRRALYVALSESYHGDTLGAVSVGGIPLFHSTFGDLLFQVEFAPCPARAADAEAAAAGLEAILARHRGQVAAVILEPLVQAAGGILVSPPGYLARARRLCDEYDTLLIADEVATGFGRTGRMFACEHEAVVPDLLCLAKGLTGGYLPLAATLATEAIYEAFLGEPQEVKPFFHGHSYTGNPLACAAALANLEIFERERVIEQLPPKIERVRNCLRKFAERANVGDVRQCGLMVGIELVRDRATGEPYPRTQAGALWAEGSRVCRRARSLGLITRPLGDVVVFMPPLASSEADLEAMLAILYRALLLETEGAEPA